MRTDTRSRSPVTCRPPALTRFLAVAWLLAAGPAFQAVAGEGFTGEQLYRAQCARCHGEHGEGTDEAYPQPLAGDRGLAELTSFIARTMPEDTQEKCTGRDAQTVAEYIYEAFYSKVAQARNQPPRIELSRLTVRQYRHSLADLIGVFRESRTVGDERGLRGEYYKSRRFRRSDKVLERIDPELAFDFGDRSPVPDKLEPREFSIRWQGSVFAPEAGEYEFVVKTDHAVRLWVNDVRDSRPLIDAWVKSGNDNEYRQSIHLLNGRFYPVRLEFSKANQGVAKKDDKAPIAQARLTLQWKLPGRAAETIPARYLTPDVCSETFVSTAPFPPDDRSVGYERGTSISKEWESATTDAALEVAGYVAARIDELAGVRDGTTDRGERLREAAARFATAAFRRPLDAEQRQFFVDRQFDQAADAQTALKRVVLLVLKSPRFLFREISGPQLNGYDVASRLSFGLWDSLPDEKLLQAAAAGELASREQVSEHARRMVSDPRCRAKVREFLLQWLKVDQLPEVSKDPSAFPKFNEVVASDLRTSLDLFLEDVVWSSSSDYRQLLLADYLYLNGRLAEIYGAELPPDAPFQKVYLDRDQRAGVLSHPYLMAGFAYTATSSPIHRGVFITRSILGRTLRPPPEAVAPLPADLHATLTTRERVTLQTGSESCQSCHAMINPLGFALEHFDAVGRYRNEERGRPVDTSGSYRAESGELVKFRGVQDLATFLVGSSESHAAFIDQLFHYMIKQPIRAYGAESREQLLHEFVERDFSIREALIEIATLAALARQPGTPNPVGARP